MYKVVALQIADSIDLKTCRLGYNIEPLYSDADELFYETDGERYYYIFKYGAVSFFNFTNEEIDASLQVIYPFCRNRFEKTISDEFIVEAGAKEYKMGYNKIDITRIERNVLRIIMLNVSQSVTLDYYSEQTSKLLEETNFHTQIMEKKGRLAITGKNLKMFIGKTLLLKNRIAENLYIFDSPPETWEDERLDKLYTELKRNFDLQERFRNVSEGLGIVKENLDLFKDILQYRNTVMLEWIIIGLIAIEVVHYLLNLL